MMAIVKGMNDPCAVLRHDPEKVGTGFPSQQTRSVCADIMFKQDARA
jgi:hypothetical protein